MWDCEVDSTWVQPDDIGRTIYQRVVDRVVLFGQAVPVSSRRDDGNEFSAVVEHSLREEAVCAIGEAAQPDELGCGGDLLADDGVDELFALAG